MECADCNSSKQELTIDGRRRKLCLTLDCLISSLLSKYEDCAHPDFETVGDGLFRCEECGMNATDSFLKYR